MLFGNLVKQPAFVDLLKDEPSRIRIATSLPNADKLMNNALFLGTYPGLTSRCFIMLLM